MSDLPWSPDEGNDPSPTRPGYTRSGRRLPRREPCPVACPCVCHDGWHGAHPGRDCRDVTYGTGRFE